MYNVLVVKDGLPCLDKLKNLIDRSDFQWKSAKTAAEALQTLNICFDFDLLVLNLISSSSPALELLRKLQQSSRYADLLIFIYSKIEEAGTKISAFDLGADDYFTENMTSAEICLRIESRLRRRQKAPENIIREEDLLLEFHLLRASLRTEGVYQNMHLTGKEFKILCLLVQNAGRTFGRNEIVNLIWGPEIHIEGRTVDSHIRGLRLKMGSMGRRLEAVAGVGYRFSAGEFSSLQKFESTNQLIK